MQAVMRVCSVLKPPCIANIKIYMQNRISLQMLAQKLTADKTSIPCKGGKGGGILANIQII